jgi:cell division protein ZapB
MAMTVPDHASRILDLSKRLDRLLEATRKLSADNISLKQQLDALNQERTALQGKHAMARHRVEAMIGRLNDLEQSDE